MPEVTIITGANRGIGLALATELVQRARVVAVCRTSSVALRKLDLEIVDGIDVAEAEAGLRLKESIGDRVVTMLIHNAGLFVHDTLEDFDAEALRRQSEINALAPLLLTRALLPNFSPSARIGLISSHMGSVANNTSGQHYGYRMSKASLNMAGRTLAVDLAPRGILVGIVHPGRVQTAMSGHRGDTTAQQAAADILKRLAMLTQVV